MKKDVLKVCLPHSNATGTQANQPFVSVLVTGPVPLSSQQQRHTICCLAAFDRSSSHADVGMTKVRSPATNTMYRAAKAGKDWSVQKSRGLETNVPRHESEVLHVPPGSWLGLICVGMLGTCTFQLKLSLTLRCNWHLRWVYLDRMLDHPQPLTHSKLNGTSVNGTFIESVC